MGGVNQSVSAGIGGFLAFFLLAGALWFLMRSMNTRLRNLRYNEEAEAARRASEADADLVSRPSAPSGGAQAPVAGDRSAGDPTIPPGGPVTGAS